MPHLSHSRATALSSALSVPSSLRIRTLALNAVEAVQGTRPLEQLARLVTSEVFEQLSQQRALRLDRNAVFNDKRRVVPIPGRVISFMPHADKVHASVVMHTENRSFAVALRLERFGQRWRATELAVL